MDCAGGGKAPRALPSEPAQPRRYATEAGRFSRGLGVRARTCIGKPRSTRGLLEHFRHELVVPNVELAAFVVVSMIESLTHNAVIFRPDLLGDAFECEVAAAVTRYLQGSDPTLPQRRDRAEAS